MHSSNFQDIMAPRRLKDDAFAFMSRYWNPQPAFKKERYITPQDLKDDVTNSIFMQKIIEQLSSTTMVSPDALKKEMLDMLEEIGLDRKMYVTRWLGILTIKVLTRMKTGVFVNEQNMFHLKSTMGFHPVIFLPTHRSYADFILMTYVCYHYDIEFPAVAAGMDFHSMAVMGRAMRDTCAFYTRRTFVGAPLYAATFKRYVRSLVTKHHSPIEFFVEGTRSRSNKTMLPKYGLLSMVLSPLLTQELNDITIVPVNITYERLVEQKLFACEHLGIPKPKETTSGLLRAMNIINESFGDIYINIGKPLSTKQMLGNRSILLDELGKPPELHEITKNQYAFVQEVGLEVIHQQEQYSIVTIFNLIAVIIMKSLYRSEPLHIQELQEEIKWLITLFRKTEANLVIENDDKSIKSGIEACLKTHTALIKLDKDKNVRLNGQTIVVNTAMKNKMKGHHFSDEMMYYAIPVISIQLYINPLIHWIIQSAIIVTLLSTKSALRRDELHASYSKIRNLLHYEFPLHKNTDLQAFERSLEFCLSEGAVILSDSNIFTLGENKKLIEILKMFLMPFFISFQNVYQVLLEIRSGVDKTILKLVQERIERSLASGGMTHPYSASLEVISNTLQSLTLAEGVVKSKSENGFFYEIREEKLKTLLQEINFCEDYLPPFGSNNIFHDKKTIRSRL